MDKLTNILLVDDDEIANHLHTLLIQDLNVSESIDIATDGEEALEIIGKYSAAGKKSDEILVIVDINMPGMDAFDFFRRFSETYQGCFMSLHVALLSSSVNWRDKKKAAQYELSEFMDKPLTETKLLDLIKRIRSKSIAHDKIQN